MNSPIEWDDLWRRLASGAIERLPRIVLILALAVIVIRSGKKLLGRFERRLKSEDARVGRTAHRSRTLAAVLRSALSIVVWTIALLQVLAELGVKLGPMVAGAGIAGVALGFGAQSLVRDFLSGFFILLEDQFRVGDRIEVEGVMGAVERFTLRLTSVRSMDGTLHHIPNGQMRRVSNSSVDWSVAIVDVGAPYGERLSRIRAALETAGARLCEDPEMAPLVVEPPQILGIEDFAQSHMTIRVAIKTAPGRRWPVARAFRQHVKEVFDEIGIELESPQTLVLQGQGGGPELVPQTAEEGA